MLCSSVVNRFCRFCSKNPLQAYTTHQTTYELKTLIQISPQLQGFHLAASVGRTVQWDMFLPKEPATSPRWLQRELYESIRGQPNRLPCTWHGTAGPPFLPCFACYCFRFPLSARSKPWLFWIRQEGIQSMLIYFMWQATFLWKVSQDQNLPGGAHLAVSPPSIWSNTKLAFIFLIKKK